MNEQPTEGQARFWSHLSQVLGQGTRLKDALAECARQFEEGELKTALEAVAGEVAEGRDLDDAIKAHPETFSRVMTAMMAAGQMAGLIDVAAGRIAEGMQRGAFAPPGEEPGAEGPARYWLLMGTLLGAGIPLVETLELVGEETESAVLREATEAMREAIIEGGSVADAMKAFPDLFDPALCEAVAAGQNKGELDVQALRIADRLAAGGDLRGLTGASGPQPEAESEADALARQMILEAAERKASDIHLEPTVDGRGKVRYRIDGALHAVACPPEGMYDALVNRVKSMAALDLAERRLPQAGRIVVKWCAERLDLRVATVPSILGERVCIRILNRLDVILTLDRILSQDDLGHVRSFCRLPHGLVVCAGPAGSGKTTLMYAMLNEVDREAHCVCSLEDPVEFRLDGVTQVQVQPRIGLTFAQAARAVMRQDPDVVMIGELRDLETSELAANMAVTGHLVLSQLHATTAPDALMRLLDMGVQPFMLNASVKAVIAQRLIRCLCPDCKVPIDAPVDRFPPGIAAYVEELGARAFHQPRGCDACSGTGYRGRRAIHEVLVMENEICKAVSSASSSGADSGAAIRAAALAAGMRTLMMSGFKLAAEGLTSTEEVLRVAPYASAG